ncbi:MAG: tetratricopeptide repeat protein [Treponema sp.]|nr:tetratricopeptide repeat protein [Treponema sp.]
MREYKISSKKLHLIYFSVIISMLSVICIGCGSMAASAEEYYLIGMSYFELGKYEEAERWLNRARQSDRTMVASTYNLGRLAFERERYEEAAKHFEGILKKDQDNILALRAAAYTRIKMGDIQTAEKHYSRLLAIVPESADEGYNHALVLYAMGRYSDAESVLDRYHFSLLENKDSLLLFARSQKAQNKVEAIESYTSWLNNNSDYKVRYEYAQILEYHQLYARALEEYRKALADSPAAAVNPAKSDIRFSLARVLLTAESASSLGITELEAAVNEGFADIAAAEELLKIRGLSALNTNNIRNIINNMRRAASEE